MKAATTAALVALLLSACATEPKIPAELQYSPPIGGAESVATITADIVDSKVPLFDNYNTYVYAIDGKRVMTPEKQWTSALPILPGDRTITIAFRQGVYMAFAKVDATLVASGAYQVKSSCDNHAVGKPHNYCDFWVVEKTRQKPVSEISRGSVGGSVPTMIFLPR